MPTANCSRPDDTDWTGAEIKSCYRLASLLDVPVAWFFENIDISAASGRVRKDADGFDMPDTRTLSRRETLDLVRAYGRISDRKLRRKVFAMARALAEA